MLVQKNDRPLQVSIILIISNIFIILITSIFLSVDFCILPLTKHCDHTSRNSQAFQFGIQRLTTSNAFSKLNSKRKSFFKWRATFPYNGFVTFQPFKQIITEYKKKVYMLNKAFFMLCLLEHRLQKRGTSGQDCVIFSLQLFLFILIILIICTGSSFLGHFSP